MHYFFLFTLLFLLFIMDQMLFRSNKLYNARFLNQHEIRRLLPLVDFSLWRRFWNWVLSLFGIQPKSKGFCIGSERQLSFERACKHLCVVGSTGSKKSQSIILPSILNANCSLIISDPSGEIYSATSKYLQRRKKYKIQVIDFRPDATHGHCYNLLLSCKDVSELKAKFERLYEAAYLGTHAGSENSAFWKTMAVSLLFTLALLLQKNESKYQNLANLRFLVQKFSAYPFDILKMILKTRDLTLIQEYETVMSCDDKVRRNIATTALSCLNLISDPRVAALTAHNTLDLKTLRKQKTALYIIVPEQDTSYYSPIISLLFMDIFNMAMQPVKKDDYGLQLLLDEAANIGVIQKNRFASLLATVRKRKCAVCIVLQSIAQLEIATGKAEAEVILGNTVSKIFLSGTDDPTAQMLSRKLGNTTVQYTNVDNTEIIEGTRPLLSPSEAQLLPENMGIFIHHNFRAGLIKLTPAYQHRVLKRRMKTRAEIKLPKIPFGDVPLLNIPKSSLPDKG